MLDLVLRLYVLLEFSQSRQFHNPRLLLWHPLMTIPLHYTEDEYLMVSFTVNIIVKLTVMMVLMLMVVVMVVDVMVVDVMEIITIKLHLVKLESRKTLPERWFSVNHIQWISFKDTKLTEESETDKHDEILTDTSTYYVFTQVKI